MTLPHHVAIIMDGNGRWATSKGLPRAEGHRRGVEALRKAVRFVGEKGVKVLTIYSFSTENWQRPAAEVSILMTLLKQFFKKDLIELHESGVCVKIIGSRAGLPKDIIALIENAEKLTLNNDKLTLLVAFNYGGRQEIIEAANEVIAKGVALTQESLQAALYTSAYPDPDLIIRTSGEERLSNFLLWQAAYSEFVFLPVLWPDFSASDFDEALEIYEKRVRRYGGV